MPPGTDPVRLFLISLLEIPPCSPEQRREKELPMTSYHVYPSVHSQEIHERAAAAAEQHARAIEAAMSGKVAAARSMLDDVAARYRALARVAELRSALLSIRGCA